MLDHDEAATLRLERMFATINIAAFGSLWFVPEALWKEKHAGEYDVGNRRAGHPGCSLRKTSVTLGVVPLLHGTSTPSFTYATVVVQDVLSEHPKTFFGGLPPIPVSLSRWQGRARITPANKPRLTSEEEASLINLCVKKGWL